MFLAPTTPEQYRTPRRLHHHEEHQPMSSCPSHIYRVTNAQGREHIAVSKFSKLFHPPLRALALTEEKTAIIRDAPAGARKTTTTSRPMLGTTLKLHGGFEG